MNESKDKEPTAASTAEGEGVGRERNPQDFAEGRERLRALVVDMLRTVYDPEIPVNILDLGLIYDVAIDERNRVDVRMTLTAPACPVAGSIVMEVEGKLRCIPGVSEAKVELVFDPPWSPERMSEEAKLTLGIM